MGMLEELEAIEAAVITSGIGGVILGCRFLFKLFRSDVTDYRADSSRVDLITHYKDLSDSYRVKAEEAEARADTFAAERNVAIKEIGELRGKVEAQNVLIHSLQVSVKRLEKLITKQSSEGVG